MGLGKRVENQRYGCPTAVVSHPYDGSLFIASLDCRIRRVDRDGVISTVAGTGQGGYGGDGGPAAAARIGTSYRYGLAVGCGGALLVVDADSCRVRRVR